MVSPSTMTFKNLEVTLSIKLITWSPCSPVHGGLRILLNPLPRAAAPPVESCTCNGTCLPLVKTSPDGASGKEPACQCRRLKRLQFNPWVGKIPWRRAWKPTPVFLPGESPGTEEPGKLLSVGSQRVGYNQATKQSTQLINNVVTVSGIQVYI